MRGSEKMKISNIQWNTLINWFKKAFNGLLQQNLNMSISDKSLDKRLLLNVRTLKRGYNKLFNLTKINLNTKTWIILLIKLKKKLKTLNISSKKFNILQFPLKKKKFLLKKKSLRTKEFKRKVLLRIMRLMNNNKWM